MVVIKSAFLTKNLEEMIVQNQYPLFNYFISNIITLKNGKKQKSVKFSGVNQVYLIHTIDEIKEFLPDMYWKYDIMKNTEERNKVGFYCLPESDRRELVKNQTHYNYSFFQREKNFVPLTRKKFVYEPKNTPPIVIQTNSLKTSSSSPKQSPSSSSPSSLSPNKSFCLINTKERKKVEIYYSPESDRRELISNLNTTCFDTNKRNDNIFKENTNSLPLISNELDINENIVFSYPPHSTKYKLLHKDKIPHMFDGIQCHTKV
jgi:hypothetical protein